MFQLHVIVDGQDARVIVLGPRPVYLGRSPGNDLILADSSVSGRHVAFWCGADEAFVEDLHSKNGTWVAGQRVHGVRRVVPDEVLVLAAGVRLVVKRVADEAQSALGSPLVEDPVAGVLYPFRSDRFRIGSAPDSDLVIPEIAAHAAVLGMHPDGQVWLGLDDDERLLSAGEKFEVFGRELLVRMAPVHLTATREIEPTGYPYAIAARLDPRHGPEATVSHLDGAEKVSFGSDNRAMLMYLLARQLLRDREAGKVSSEAGWYEDEELGMDLWGRSAAASHANNLHVLLCRTRRELRAAGFDPWFVEKRNRCTRARVARVDVR